MESIIFTNPNQTRVRSNLREAISVYSLIKTVSLVNGPLLNSASQHYQNVITIIYKILGKVPTSIGTHHWKNILHAFKMRRIINIFTFGVFLASMLTNGFSMTLPFFDEVSKKLPFSDCDMIVVSSSPIQGNIYNY